MMDLLRMWLIGVTVISLLLSLAETLVTQEGVRRVLRLAGGVLIILTMARPLLRWAGEIPAISLAQYAQETAALEENFAAEQEEMLSALIAEEVGAYISDKAEELGLSCTAAVEVAVEGGVPLPRAAVLSIPYCEELSIWMARELKIERECQTWQESGRDGGPPPA